MDKNKIDAMKRDRGQNGVGGSAGLGRVTVADRIERDLEKIGLNWIKKNRRRRIVQIRLDLDLSEGIEKMAQSSKIAGLVPAPRKFTEMIRRALEYAVWKWSQGEGPDVEMCRLPRGYRQWAENVPDGAVRSLAKMDTDLLNRLFRFRGNGPVRPRRREMSATKTQPKRRRAVPAS